MRLETFFKFGLYILFIFICLWLIDLIPKLQKEKITSKINLYRNETLKNRLETLGRGGKII